jgi:hypothetical protein
MKPSAPPPEPSGEKVPIWIISFADMITLLLSFFVMLTSFSTYNKGSLDHLRQTSAMAYPSLHSYRRMGRNSLVDGQYTCIVQTHGSESSAEATWGKDAAPENPASTAPGPRVFRIPLSAMFLGDSTAGPQGGRDLGSDLHPDSFAARGGKRTELHRPKLHHHRGRDDLALGADLDPDLGILHRHP